MKTNSRKRLLVSSVAMLLVAMLALGTATYAWFTQDTTATADKLSVQTVKASELKLAAKTGEWTDQLHYNYTGKVLKPASSADGVHWFNAVAAAKTAYGAGSTITDISTTAVTDNNGYVFANQLNIYNAGDAAVEDVTITFSLTEEGAQTDGAEYLRLALVPVAKRYNATDGLPTPTNFADHVYGVVADDQAYPLTSTAGAVSSTAVKTLNGASGSVSITSIAAKTAVYYNLYVWFEGQDEDCYDAEAGHSMPEITFTVSGDTVEQN